MMGDSARKKPAEWTTRELTIMRESSHLGAKAVSEELKRLGYDRSPEACYQQAHRMRLSLRKTGSRRGLRLGQPKGVSLKDLGAMGEDALDGNFDMVEAARRIAEEADLPTCPACGKRKQQNRDTGMCRQCHVEELLKRHRDEERTRALEKELAKARQEKRRATLCQSCGRIFHPRVDSDATICRSCAS